jgi:hypothetical protein
MHPLADLTLSHYIEDGRSDVLVEDGVGIFCRLHPVWVGDAPDDVMAMPGCIYVPVCPYAQSVTSISLEICLIRGIA